MIMKKIKNFNRNMPLRLFNSWILFTLLIFAIGPIEYRNCNKWYAILFMVFFLICANFFGYVGSKIHIGKPRAQLYFSEKKIINFTIIYSFVITVLILLESILKIGLPSWTLDNLFKAMAQTYSFQKEYTFLISLWIISYTKWIRAAGLILGMLYWKKINKKYKILYIITVFVIIGYNTFFIGSQKELIDTTIYLGLPILMNWYANGKKISFKRKLIMFLVAISILVFMATVIESRHILWSDLYNSKSSLLVDKENWIYLIFPDKQVDTLIYIFSYLTQGYRGLALCLTLPFVWAKGMGSSFKIMNDVSRWLSIPVSTLEISYPVRMEAEYGVGAYASWHSIFPWIASDFTFIGSIFIVSIFIYYWMKSWNEFIKYKTWISGIMFCHLSILVVYIPCNNQLFQTRDSIVATLMIFIFWYLYHGKRSKNKIVRGRVDYGT